jgi:hypothetical protein
VQLAGNAQPGETGADDDDLRAWRKRMWGHLDDATGTLSGRVAPVRAMAPSTIPSRSSGAEEIGQVDVDAVAGEGLTASPGPARIERSGRERWSVTSWSPTDGFVVVAVAVSGTAVLAVQEPWPALDHVDRVLAGVQEAVVATAEQHEVVEVGASALFPGEDVVGVHEPCVPAAGEGTTVVALQQCSPLCRARHSALSAHPQRPASVVEEQVHPRPGEPGAHEAGIDGVARVEHAGTGDRSSEGGGIDGDVNREALPTTAVESPVLQADERRGRELAERIHPCDVLVEPRALRVRL